MEWWFFIFGCVGGMLFLLVVMILVLAAIGYSERKGD